MALERSQDVWFEDGNCVLRAENIIFKVYSGLLMQSSPVFRDMFSMPQPDTEDPNQETYEGYHVIRMEGDSATELTRFLKAIFDQQ